MMGGGMVSCWIQPTGSVAKMGITLENFGLVGVNQWALQEIKTVKHNLLLFVLLNFHGRHVSTQSRSSSGPR
jgi:hypothetical protein